MLCDGAAPSLGLHEAAFLCEVTATSNIGILNYLHWWSYHGVHDVEKHEVSAHEWMESLRTQKKNGAEIVAGAELSGSCE